MTDVCVSGKQCSGYGQCVERAECSSDTYGLCVCERGYFNKNGRCASLAQPGSPCTGKEQCVPNTICFKTCICQVTMGGKMWLLRVCVFGGGVDDSDDAYDGGDDGDNDDDEAGR